MSESNDVKGGNMRLNPTAITVEIAAKMLRLPADIIRKHIEQGAPTAADGTINLVHYAAWLCNRLQAPGPQEFVSNLKPKAQSPEPNVSGANDHGD